MPSTEDRPLETDGRPQTTTVDALLPLSLLEAMRTIDTPRGEQDAEYVDELRSKRLGLSDTVYAQIRRYTLATRRKERLPLEEVAAIARLIGRRPDAEHVFRNGGEYLAERIFLRIARPARWAIRFMPSVIARPIAFRQAQRVAERYYNGTVERVGSFVLLAVQDSATVGAAPNGAGCWFYGAGLGVLLRRLLGAGSSVEHVRCADRGDTLCQWRADWRAGR